MVDLPSTEFRRTFQNLTEPTRVTSHRHLMGTWLPGEMASPLSYLDEADLTRREEIIATVAALTAERDALRAEVKDLKHRLAIAHSPVDQTPTVIADGTKGMTRGVGIGATVKASHQEGDVRVIDDLTLNEFSVSSFRPAPKPVAKPKARR